MQEKLGIELLKDSKQYFESDVDTSACQSGGRYTLNSLRPRQNGRHFPDDIFKRIFFNENVWISLKFSLKFIPRIRINNIPALN